MEQTKITIVQAEEALRSAGMLIDEINEDQTQIDFHNQHGACFTFYAPDYLVQWHCVTSNYEPDSWEDEKIDFAGTCESLIHQVKDAKPYGY